ncbi:adenine deaminase [Chryseobacterium gambrini]|uniref:Adenine deaminase n=1 Tax=Chryseobacterium gambrini TaxID=373672 RepID=A0AAJ1VMF4_9FLAO|nr:MULTISPECIES: adenine deaminase [Chryseobacterium]MDN4014796.1 adenine deaminase [Chryseobacterium gambrini]MDN4027882.1 adenine deaminase [Chryseobacterium gambrini]QWA39681.1 adenine deaminase [Chryseobacterium sp. ZHDP1]
MDFTIKSNLIDIVAKETYPAEIIIKDNKISSIQRISEKLNTYVLPGFIDAHVHIESSMLVPSEFAKIAVKHGTVGTISDPHEIANVLGVSGVDYMIENAQKVPFHFYFGAPSCVPATHFETAGAVIDSGDIDGLLSKKEIVYLAEMMNFPGVIYKDEEVLKKLESAKKHNKPIDGHAPGLMGEEMRSYFSAGISTDHECFGYQEALEKLEFGVKVMIREGSAAKNFDTLIPLLKDFPDQMMFCCDDKHPDNLLESHINDHVKRALDLGYDLYDVLRTSSYNVVKHYNLPVGLLQIGDNADFIEIDNLTDFTILKTYINGALVSENGESFIESVEAATVNNFSCSLKSPSDFKVKSEGEKVRVIETLDGQLITKEIHAEVLNIDGFAESDPENDILKIAVVNRYQDAPVATAFIKNIGLKNGAIASCVAHDCHNIVVVGTNDDDICKAVNLIIQAKGGISLAHDEEEMVLELPIAGIMTDLPAEKVAEAYIKLDRRAKELGSRLRAPYMSLSFMALLVIPELKLSDKGLFNGKSFDFTDVFIKSV